MAAAARRHSRRAVPLRSARRRSSPQSTTAHCEFATSRESPVRVGRAVVRAALVTAGERLELDCEIPWVDGTARRGRRRRASLRPGRGGLPSTSGSSANPHPSASAPGDCSPAAPGLGAARSWSRTSAPAASTCSRAPHGRRRGVRLPLAAADEEPRRGPAPAVAIPPARARGADAVSRSVVGRHARARPPPRVRLHRRFVRAARHGPERRRPLDARPRADRLGRSRDRRQPRGRRRHRGLGSGRAGARDGRRRTTRGARPARAAADRPRRGGGARLRRRPRARRQSEPSLAPCSTEAAARALVIEHVHGRGTAAVLGIRCDARRGDRRRAAPSAGHRRRGRRSPHACRGSCCRSDRTAAAIFRRPSRQRRSRRERSDVGRRRP